ncbi:MAG: hypothetical protein H6661_09485 [Ardenticatenaceae bacterium]|nr:hypothetical protein [Ardenticatenaceae bacterium]
MLISRRRRKRPFFAKFLTNASQSATLMREISRVPANRTVKVDSTTQLGVAGFATQARTAVPVPNIPANEYPS